MKYKNIVDQMALEEKAGMCSGSDYWTLKGVERLRIPQIRVADGPHGIRRQVSGNDCLGINQCVPATCFPAACTTGSSWDRELLWELGEAIAEEALEEKVSVVLGPGVNIKRSPLCGRNFEYFSEDPYLTGELAAHFIDGVQSKGVGTSIKHFAANNQETRRMVINTVVDERALREIYLTGFEIAVKKSHPWTVMCAYPKLNGTYCSENKKLLKDILKNEWGFNGIVVSDWGAVNDRVKGLIAGLDLEMPGPSEDNGKLIIEAVKSGKLDEKVLDETVDHLLELIFKAKENLKQDYKYDREEHHRLARRIASQSAVLLKNEGSMLPLSRDMRIAVLGDMAEHPRYQGTGSSHIDPTRLTSALDELKEQNISFKYSRDFDEKTIEGAEAVILYLGLTEDYESEGFDRENISLPDEHIKMIEKVYEKNKNIIVVLSGGSPIEMPWLNKAKAVLNCYLGGQAGGSASVDVLFGDVNPSGKLAETYPLKIEDTPCFNNFPGNKRCVEYKESIYVGYRHYDKAGKDVLFPFGFGLSYTSFEYAHMTLSTPEIEDAGNLTVSIDIKNTGSMDGAEVVQLYVRDTESAIFKAPEELKGFEKVFLKKGETKTVMFKLDKRSFAYFNVNKNDWSVENGEYEILIGASSRDIRARQTVFVRSAHTADSLKIAGTVDSLYIPDRDFAALANTNTHENEEEGSSEFTMDSTFEDMLSKFIGRVIFSVIEKIVGKYYGGVDYKNPSYRMYMETVKYTPMKRLVLMSEGMMPQNMAEGIVDMCNGRLIRGAIKLIKR